MWSLVEIFVYFGAIQRIKVNGGNYDDYIYIKSLSGQQDCLAKLFTYAYVLHLETYYLCTYDVVYDVISVHAWCISSSILLAVQQAYSMPKSSHTLFGICNLLSYIVPPFSNSFS